MKSIGPIRFRYLPPGLAQDVEAFKVHLAERVKEEFCLETAPEVHVEEYRASYGAKPQVRLNAQLVGIEYGRLVHLVSQALFFHAENSGVQLELLRFA